MRSGVRADARAGARAAERSVVAPGEAIAGPVHAADAERLGETEVATFDRRDLGIVRPRHCERFTLLA